MLYPFFCNTNRCIGVRYLLTTSMDIQMSLHIQPWAVGFLSPLHWSVQLIGRISINKSEDFNTVPKRLKLSTTVW